MQGTGAYSDELWVIFCQFGDDPWDTYTDNIAQAKASTNFIYDRSEWGVEVNFSLHVSKKVPWWN